MRIASPTWAGLWRSGVTLVVASLVFNAGTQPAESTAGCNSLTGTVPHHAVGVTTVTLVDRHRGTPAQGSAPSTTTRTLETTILYPARGHPRDVDLRDAPPARSRHGFPLVVRAHGLGGGPDTAESLLRDWAAAGYVVAMPRFPLSNRDAPGRPHSDVVAQSEDVAFVVRALLRLHSSVPGLAHTIDRSAVGLSGFSDGGTTVLTTMFDSCCQTTRLRAVVATSSGLLNPGEATERSTRSTPLLLIRGDADPNYPRTAETFATARAPKVLMTLHGAPHQVYTDPWRTIVERAEIAFFDRYLRNDHRGLAVLRDIGNCRPLVALQTRLASHLAPLGRRSPG
jgi:dienelactone hydrolase